MNRTLHKVSVLGTVLTLLTVLAVNDAVAQIPHERTGWMLGISWGLGKGRFRDAAGDETEIKDGASPQWRIGKFLSRRWLVHFEYEGWLIENGDLAQKYRRSLQNFLVAVTYYPGNPDNYWGGLYLRFGVGLGLGGTALVELEDQEQVSGIRHDEAGTGVLVGFGYEFRICRSFAAGIGLSSNYLNIRKDFIYEAWFIPLKINLSWYF